MRSARASIRPSLTTDLDAVVIATPNSLHPAMTELAAVAGAHILLEKPVGLDNHAIDSMVRWCAQAGVLCQVNMILRWHPMIESIVRLRDEGALGDVHTVEADFIFGELEGSEPDWARTAADGGSLHLYAGCHAYDQVEWLMGDRVAEVSAVSSRRSGKWEYDVTSCAVMRFARTARTRDGHARGCSSVPVRHPRVRYSRDDGERHGVHPDKHGAEYIEHCTQRVDVTYLPFDRVAADFIHNVATGDRFTRRPRAHGRPVSARDRH